MSQDECHRGQEQDESRDPGAEPGSLDVSESCATIDANCTEQVSSLSERPSEHTPEHTSEPRDAPDQVLTPQSGISDGDMTEGREDADVARPFTMRERYPSFYGFGTAVESGSRPSDEETNETSDQEECPRSELDAESAPRDRAASRTPPPTAGDRAGLASRRHTM